TAVAVVRGGGLVPDPDSRRRRGGRGGCTDEGGCMNALMPDVADIRRLRRSAARLARTRYPAFLFGREVPAGEIPVFTYHEIDGAELERDLDFLERNGYRTLSIDDYHERMRNPRLARD